MVKKLRTILAENIKTYRNKIGLSKMKLADFVDTVSNNIAMIEAEKRFPSDTMIEKIAATLQREPFELFSISPIQKQWEAALLDELMGFIDNKLQESQKSQRKLFA